MGISMMTGLLCISHQLVAVLKDFSVLLNLIVPVPIFIIFSLMNHFTNLQVFAAESMMIPGGKRVQHHIYRTLSQFALSFFQKMISKNIFQPNLHSPIHHYLMSDSPIHG